MRLRNVQGSRETIASTDFVVHEPREWKNKWNQIFDNNNPIHIEIGMGKGKFIIEQAMKNPNINYIGIEKYSSVLVRAISKREQYELDNLVFIRFDAEYVNEIFAEGEISRIYLNFSDPWPKERHAKRRLTSKEFLSRYNICLKKEGEVIFKTDNVLLFEFSLEEVQEANWILNEVTFDLHHSEYLEGNVMTEYEEKFVAQGNPIHRMLITRE